MKRAKTKLGKLEKKLFLTSFSNLKLFFVFFLRFLNIIRLDQIQKSHSFYKKKLQSLNETTNFVFR